MEKFSILEEQKWSSDKMAGTIFLVKFEPFSPHIQLIWICYLFFTDIYFYHDEDTDETDGCKCLKSLFKDFDARILFSILTWQISIWIKTILKMCSINWKLCLPRSRKKENFCACQVMLVQLIGSTRYKLYIHAKILQLNVTFQIVNTYILRMKTVFAVQCHIFMLF